MFIKKEDYLSVCDRGKEALMENKSLKNKLKSMENNQLLFMEENRKLRDTIRQIIVVSNENTYGNAEARIRKIKELASKTFNY